LKFSSTKWNQSTKRDDENEKRDQVFGVFIYSRWRLSIKIFSLSENKRFEIKPIWAKIASEQECI
jgi:hypothetical protein